MSARGRGGRFMNRRIEKEEPKEEDDINDILNDMKSDDEFSKKSDKIPQHTRLHIANIPSSLTEGSLRHLFSEFGNATVFLGNAQQIGPKNKRWGFVEFPTSYEANNALSALNDAHPYYLQISFARNTDENNSETEDWLKKDIQTINNDRETFRGKGRGSHVPLTGRSPNSFRPKNKEMESYSNGSDDTRNSRYSNSRFQHDDTPADILETNDVYGSLSKLSVGKRSVTMGRGVSKIERKENYFAPKLTGKIESKIDEFMNNAMDIRKEEIRGFKNNHLPFELGKCGHCNRVSTYTCCQCRHWYCSLECAHEHLTAMGVPLCESRKVSFSQVERNGASNGDDHNRPLQDKKCVEIQDSEKRRSRQFESNLNNDQRDKRRSKTPNSRGSRYSDGSDEDKISKQKVAGYKYFESPDSESRRSRQYEERTNRDINSRDKRRSKTPSGRGERYSNSLGDDKISEQRIEGDYKMENRGTVVKGEDDFSPKANSTYDDNEPAFKSIDKNRRSSGYEDRQARFGENKTGTGRQGGNKFQGNQNRPDRRPFTNRNNQHDDDVYVRSDTSSPRPLKRMVIVSCTTKDENVYWVYKKSSVPDMLEMMKALDGMSKSSKAVQPSVDFVCAAPFNDDWYRAKIIKVIENSAIVRFLDYGNESKVRVEELKLLPKELVSKPPLSFKIQIQGKPVKLNENEEVVITLLKTDAGGTWKVTLADTDTPLEKPTITSSQTEVSKEPALSFDLFEKVNIMDGKDGEYYVQLENDTFKLVQMSTHLGQHESIKVNPKLGELYVKTFADLWCRAKLIKEHPLTVFYIDYGNSEVVKKEDLHPVPDEYKNLDALAFKIKLAEGTSNDYLNLPFSSELCVKAVNQLKDGTLVVQVKGETYQTEDKNNDNLYPKGVYSDKERNCKHIIGLVKDGDTGVWFCAQKVMSSECLTGSLSLQTKSMDYISMLDLSALLKNVETSDNYKATVGDLVIVRAKSTWCRGYIMLIVDDDVSVALIDYGKTVVVKEKNITALPPRFQSHPVRQAVRVIFEKPLDNKEGMIGNEIRLTNVKKLNNSLKCTFGDYGEVNIITWTPLIEEAGLRVFPLQNNSSVILSAFHTPRSVYLRSANKPDCDKLGELLQDITHYSAKAGPLRRKPLCGELLCVKYHEDSQYYRAQVFEKADEETYKVNFVDFGNTEIVSIDDMQVLPDTFKKVPCFAVKVGLKNVVAHNFNPQAMAYLNKLTLSEAHLLMMYDDNLSEVTLSEPNGHVINSDLIGLMESSLKSLEMPAVSQVKKFESFTGDDVLYEDWPVNSRINLMVLVVQNFRTVMGLNKKSNLLNHLFRYLTPKITKYCNESAQKSYNPRANEMVLAKYKDESEDVCWFRAVCIKPMRSSAFVLFIDYGNCGELPHTDIRIMPAEFMDSPAALKRCSIYGLSDSLSNDKKDKVKHMLDQFNAEAIVVEDNEDGNATLWIPSLYPKLLDIGIPKIDPPPGI